MKLLIIQASNDFMRVKKQKIIIILIGLVGCFLTSLTGSITVMLNKGWVAQGGFPELLHRFSIGYPASCLVVFFVFPVIVPKITQLLDQKLE
jgi:hypothetical protein